MSKAYTEAERALPSLIHSLADLRLVNSPPEEGYDALTRLAIRIFKTPVALVSIVDEANNRQFFKSQVGLGAPWSQSRQTPLTHSFCRHVKAMGEPLIVPYAPKHPLVCDNPAIRELDVIAYLGVPILGPGGNPLGAICVIDGVERQWTDDDVRLLKDLAVCVNDEIELRATSNTNKALIAKLKKSHQRVSRYNALRESMVLAFMAPDLTAEQRFHALLGAGCKALGAEAGAIARVSAGRATSVFAALADGTVQAPDKLDAHNALFSAITSGQSLLYKPDLANSDLAGRRCLFGHVPGAFIAAPIEQNGNPFGVLEFSSAAPRSEGWSDEDLSIISIILMFTSAHLGLHSQLNALRRSETALFNQLLQTRNVLQKAS